MAVTQGPGLSERCWSVSQRLRRLARHGELPLVAVDHLQGHVAANFLVPDDGGRRFRAAFSVPDRQRRTHFACARARAHQGFDTLGRTLDDAAGEAFDKGARMLGLGYPGGPALERLAAEGDPEAFEFPASGSRARGGRGATQRRSRAAWTSRSRPEDLACSTKAARALGRAQSCANGAGADLAASYQAAIVEHLMLRAEQALELTGLDRLAVGGGVAANGELRRRLQELGASVHVPPRALCTDNAAMIGAAARFAPGAGLSRLPGRSTLTRPASARC